MYTDGHEIASHSVNHFMPTPKDLTTRKFWKDEFVGQRDRLSRYAAIPLRDIRGIRAPFLANGGDEEFEVLTEAGT